MRSDLVTVVTGLTVIETLTLHDGEVMDWWKWSREAVADFGPIPRFFSVEFDGEADRHTFLADQGERAYVSPSPALQPINKAYD